MLDKTFLFENIVVEHAEDSESMILIVDLSLSIISEIMYNIYVVSSYNEE